MKKTRLSFAVGALLLLDYGYSNAIWAMVFAAIVIFAVGLPICHYSAKHSIDMDLLTRAAGFGWEVKRRIMLGTYVLRSGYYDAYYRRASQVRTLMAREFAAAFATCDVIATPTSPVPAFPLGERSADPLAMYLADVYTISANLAGLPGISVPCGLWQGEGTTLPIGLQLLGAPLGEATRRDLDDPTTIMSVAARVESMEQLELLKVLHDFVDAGNTAKLLLQWSGHSRSHSLRRCPGQRGAH